MSTKWTIQHIKSLKAEGKIRDYTVLGPAEPTPAGKLVAKHFKKKDAAKDFIARTMLEWGQAQGYVLQEEYRFDPVRKWRLDFAFEDIKMGVEYEGIMSEKSRHTTAEGYTGDTNKYNAAQAAGWKVLRFTALNYKDLITELNKHLNNTK